MNSKKMAHTKAGHHNEKQSFTNDFNTTIDVDNMKAAIDPLEFYQSRNGTMPSSTKTGWVLGGLCPFHQDTKPTSFYIHTVTGGFNCFACGTKGGDVIAYEMAIKGISFQDALLTLAEEYGIRNEATSARKKHYFSAREALLTLEKEALVINLAASDVVNGKAFSEEDFERLLSARSRVETVCREVFHD